MIGIIQTDMNTNTCGFLAVSVRNAVVNIGCLTTMATAKTDGVELKFKDEE